MINMSYALKIRFVLVVLLSIGAICATVAVTEKSKLEGKAESWTVMDDGTQALIFPVRLGKEQRVYCAAILAIVIEKIECDGELLKPVGEGMMLHSLDTKTEAGSADNVIYTLPHGLLNTVKEYDSKSGEYNALLYAIPHSARNVKVIYKVRFPSGVETGPMSVVAKVTRNN